MRLCTVLNEVYVHVFFLWRYIYPVLHMGIGLFMAGCSVKKGDEVRYERYQWVRQIHTSVNPLGCLAVWVIAVQFNGSNNYVCNWDTMIVYVWHHIHSGLHQLGRDYGKLCNCFLRGAKRLSYLFSLSIFFFFFLSSSLPVSLLPSVLSFLLPSFSSSFNYTPSLLNPEV